MKALTQTYPVEKIGPYLQARETAAKPKMVTRLWEVFSGNVPDGEVGELLCRVSWYAPWRRYCVEVDHGIVLDAACLTSLADFCQRKTIEHRVARTARYDSERTAPHGG